MALKLVMAWYWIDISIAVHSEGPKEKNYVRITNIVVRNNGAFFHV